MKAFTSSSTRATSAALSALRMAEVEAQPVLGVERAALRHVVAQRLAQRLVEEVRRRVVCADGAAARVVDLEHRAFARGDGAFSDLRDVDEDARCLLRVGNARNTAVRPQRPADRRPGRRIRHRMASG
jgi:hypothetical protein